MFGLSRKIQETSPIRIVQSVEDRIHTMNEVNDLGNPEFPFWKKVVWNELKQPEEHPIVFWLLRGSLRLCLPSRRSW
jgi:hypothetical protein